VIDRIELVIFEGYQDVRGKRLNPLKERVRGDDAGVATSAQLKRLFERL
jgi:hypothetical protein